ncbi:MAG: OmpA family protein [Oceanospirillales bacterium]|nr:MAG: OmpA family protein [Oceanospirillales bacterium]
MSLMKKLVGFFSVVTLLLLLSACQSMPQGFSQQQVRVLQQQGFEPIGDDEWMLSLSALILFGFNDHQLTEESREQVQQLGKSLLDIGITRLRVEGHADNLGDPDYNLGLSQQRADAVAIEISALGLSRDFIQSQGLGSMYPVASNETREGRAQNRRVTIIVSP